jgi:DNA glycosylase AlkZ-like
MEPAPTLGSAVVKVDHIAQSRLRRMGLLGPVAPSPLEVVRGHLAMQSQDFGPAKWSIGQRLGGSTDAEVECVISEGSILRTHVLRPTWHFVAREDLRWLMALTGPRIQQGLEARYRALGLDTKTRTRAEAVIAGNLEGANHSTRKELGEVLRKSRIDIDGQRLPFVLSHCELESVICSGRVRGKAQTYALFDERVPKGPRLDHADAVIELVTRYLTSHGPATLKDMSWWSGLTMADLRIGLEGVGSGLASESLEGMTLWWIDRPMIGKTIESAFRFLQTYDEFVVGYTESRYLGDPRRELARAAFANRSFPTSVVLFGSRVVGHWRRAVKPRTVDIEVLLYEALRGFRAESLEKAAQDLGDFMGREARLHTAAL